MQSTKVLLTSSSFYNTPGLHHKALAEKGWSVDYLEGPVSAATLTERISDYEALICGDDDLSRAVLEVGKKGNLRFISKYGVGLDKIDLVAAKELKISVFNTMGVNSATVAEHVMALLLAHAKGLFQHWTNWQKQLWVRSSGFDLFGKKLGIVGFGNIGKEVASRAKSFGLEIVAFEPLVDDATFSHFGVRRAKTLVDLVEEVEILTLHCPLNAATSNLVSSELLEHFHDNMVLINTSRGGLIEPQTVISGIKSGKISGYLADVLDEEPPSKSNPLLGVEGVWITPHVGSRTRECVERQGMAAVQNLATALS